MTLCPNCGGKSFLMARAGGADFWRCDVGGCGKMFQRPAQTKGGAVNGRECIEAVGEIDVAAERDEEGG